MHSPCVSTRHRQRGFTLIDLTIAAVVAVLVTAGGFAMISRAFFDMDVRQTAEDLLKVKDNLWAAFPVTADGYTFIGKANALGPVQIESVLPETMKPYVGKEPADSWVVLFKASHPWSGAVPGDVVIQRPMTAVPVLAFNSVLFIYQNLPADACFALVMRVAPKADEVNFLVGGAGVGIVTPAARTIDSSLVRSSCEGYTNVQFRFVKYLNDAA